MKEMKKCPRCGAIQQPERQTCIDCGKVLPDANPVFAAELAEMADDKLRGKMEWNDRSSKAYRFSFVLTIISVIIVISDLILLIIFGDTHNVTSLVIGIAAGAYTVLVMVCPGLMRRFERRFGDIGEGTRDYVTHRDRFYRMTVILVMTIIALVSTICFFVYMPEIPAEVSITANDGTIAFSRQN